MDETREITIKAVRSALTRICRKGAEPYWILETADYLTDLPLVRQRVSSANATGEELANAVVDLLKETVARIHGPHGVVLRICLALDPQYRGLSAEQRQTLAGKEFRGGDDPVTRGAIRKNHLPRALDRLANMIHPPASR